ncbi:hypothetical protein MASR1M36_19820 [Candidatus Cloacimonadaceae bacterium]
MNRILLILLFLVMVSLEARDIFTESFPNSPSLPAGWTLQSDTPAAWSVTSSSYAGGSPGELRLMYTPHYLGIQRCITPAFDTSKAYDLGLSFRHALFDWSGSEIIYALKVEISYDLSSWTTLQSLSVSADIPPTLVNIDIPYATGRAATTYISFTFEGDNNDLNYWYIDDVKVSYNNTLGSGLWDPGIYDIAGNLTVRPTDVLQLQPGTELRFGSENSMIVVGRLWSLGSADQPVIFTENILGAGWQGISLESGASIDSSLILYSEIRESNDIGLMINSTAKVRCQHCLFYGNNAVQKGGGIDCASDHVKILDCEFSHNNSQDIGGAIYLNKPQVIIQNCDFNFNTALDGAAIFCLQNAGTIAGNVFHDNYGNTSIVYLSSASLDGFQDNQFFSNSGGPAAAVLRTFGCTGQAEMLLIYNNSMHGILSQSYNGSYSHATIVNGADQTKYGLIAQTNTVINNSIIWGYEYGVYNNTSSEFLRVKYSCIQNGIAGIGGNGILNDYYINCISTDPQFRDPALYDYGLFFTSPCIDSADPTSSSDPDGSRADMGYYACAYLNNPVLFEAIDVTPDQGHRLHLAWSRSTSDATYNPLGFYSVWRQAQTRRADAIVVNNPLQAASLALGTGQQVCWLDGNRYWDYIIQVPALTQSVYGLMVETLADSSASGLHEAEYRVIYANQLAFWPSEALSGYSVDNIPPNPARGLVLMPAANNRMQLSWEEVTEGSWEGNSYPELNQISYRIYADETPDFEPGPQNYLGTTTNIQTLIDNFGYPKRFFRIISTDSQ